MKKKNIFYDYDSGAADSVLRYPYPLSPSLTLPTAKRGL